MGRLGRIAFAVGALTWAGAWSGAVSVRGESAYEPAVSLQVVANPEGGVTVEWTRESGPYHLLGWHLDRQLSSGGFVRVTPAQIEAGLFDPPSTLYRVRDAGGVAKAGDTLVYRLVVVDLELHEWPSDFASYVVGVESTPVPAPAEVAKAPRGPTPALRDVTPSGSGSRLRIAVNTNGLYRLTAAQIAAGLTGYSEAQAVQAITQTNLALSCGGTSVAWRAEAGGAALLFFGQSYRDIYTDRNVYLLAPGPGLAMESSTRPTVSVAADPWFWETARAEKDLYFQSGAAGNEDDDFFIWSGGQLTMASTVRTNWLWTTNVLLPDSYPGMKQGQVTAYLVSNYDSPGTNTLDNSTCLYAAGQQISCSKWNGDMRLAQSGIATNLGNDQVSVTVEVWHEKGVTTTVVLFDALEVRYARKMRARNDQLLFRPEPGTNVLTVRGFTNSAIQVFDLADPLRPIRIAGTVAQEGASDWRVSWSNNPVSTGLFLAVVTPFQPERIEGVAHSKWSAPLAGVPHLVIAPQALASAASALVAHRQQQGLGSLLVPVEELYDTFAFGRRDPRAIQRFLAYARTHWTVPPAYVCLAGDGHLDYHDHFGQSLTRPNHVPPIHARIPNTQGGGTGLVTVGLDSPLADMDGDGNPEMAIGRLPAQTSAALTAMINRIVTHEASDAWKNKVLLIADKDPSNDFILACDRLAGHVPTGIAVQRLNYTTNMTTLTMSNEFRQAFNSGAPLSVYLGHGNNIGMSSPYFFEHSSSRSYMSTLTNRTRTSLLLAGTCLLNDFAKPDLGSRCLGKGFLDTAPGGAVAVWASAGASSLINAEETSAAMMDVLFHNHGQRLGELVLAALEVEANSFQPWMVRASVLMGDPGTRIRTQLYTPIAISPASTNLPAARAVGQAIAIFSDISWTSTTDQAWITITGGATGTGDGTVTFTVAPNVVTMARTGTIAVAGGGIVRTCTVVQAAFVPLLAINPSSVNLESAAASNKGIAVSANVPWVAAANLAWITITGGTTGTGNGTVLYSVAANSGGYRSGTITISGGGLVQTCSVSQSAATFMPDVPADFDGDGATDIAVFQPSTGSWRLLYSGGGSNTTPFGWSAVLPVPADYDGDGIVDVAVYHTNSGKWYILPSAGGSVRVEAFGWSATVPIPGDYDGDSKADLAVFHRATARWYFKCSRAGSYSAQFGWSAVLPVPADYDGDGVTDIAIFHPAARNWYVLKSSDGKVILKQWGGALALPVPADYDGDGRVDIAVFHRATGKWSISFSGGGSETVMFGWSAVTPVPADYDGDGKADIAVYHPATGNWYIRQSMTGATIVRKLGGSTSKPTLLYPLIHSWYRLP
jgi:putative transposon-encoded protein